MSESDRYAVLEVVGTGGMATVWRARDRELDRIVALKRPHPAPPGSDVHARFGREARMAAAVSHPHLIEVFDVGHDADGPYLVMEFVDAPSLAARGRPADAAMIGGQVAEGLAALHAAGIIHRDIKPANVLLPAGGAKLTDFGIARAVDATTLTQPHLTHATPAYAAPEVLASGEHSAASDVYALGLVVLEAATGLREPATALPLLDERLRAAIGPALTADATRRPTATTLAASLRATTDGLPATEPIGAAGAAAGRFDVTTTAPVDTPPRDGARREARTAMAVFGALLLVVAIVIFAATRGADDGEAVGSLPLPIASTTEVAATSPTATSLTAATTTAAATTTTPTPASTQAPDERSTSAAPVLIDSLPATPEATLTALLGVVDSTNLLGRGKPREEFQTHLERAVEASEGDGGSEPADEQLRQAAKRIAKRVARSDDGDEIVVLMVHLADLLGVDADAVTDHIDDRG